MKIRHIYFFAVLLLFLACKPNENKTSNNTSPQTTTSQVEVNPYPAVPASFIDELLEKSFSIDYFFRGTNFSVSQNNPDAIRSAIGTLAAGVTSSEYGSNCVSPCRVSFIGDEGILADLEMFMGEGCHYILYSINGKPTYSAAYTEPGFNFINNLKSQAAKTHPQAK